MSSCQESADKVNRMYVEVRYAKASSGFGQNKSMFRLKRDGKRLLSEDYQHGLNTYFEGAEKVNDISMAELQNVIVALEAEAFPAQGGNTAEENVPRALSDPTEFDVDCRQGDHVAVAWLKEDNSRSYEWYLGVVNKLISNDSVSISYFVRKDTIGCQWTFPEVAEIRDTSMEQIVCKVTNITYQCISRIKCILQKQTAIQINEKVLALNQSY